MNHLRRQKAGQEAAALVQGTGMIIRTRTIGEEVEVVAEVEVGVDLTVTSDVEGKEIIVVEAEAEAQALITETVVEVDTVMTAEVEAGLMTGSTCPFYISCHLQLLVLYMYIYLYTVLSLKLLMVDYG